MNYEEIKKLSQTITELASSPDELADEKILLCAKQIIEELGILAYYDSRWTGYKQFDGDAVRKKIKRELKKKGITQPEVIKLPRFLKNGNDAMCVWLSPEDYKDAEQLQDLLNLAIPEANQILVLLKP